MRVSATTLESYRLWSEQDWMSESDLLATIRGEFHPTRKMLLGLAFGRALEKPDRWRAKDGGYVVYVKNEFDEWKPFCFSEDDLAPAMARYDRHGVSEVKHVRDYGGVDVVAKADHVIGTVIKETKTRIGQFDFDKYAESYQWRFMLDLFGASQVTYDVFILEDNAAEDEPLIKSVETFSFYPYPELHEDCCALLTRFLGYVAARNLEGYLQEKVWK